MAKNIAEITQKAWVRAFLQAPHIARLATCNPQTLQPHVVPVWYEWDGESAWISSFRSTRKVRELMANPRASLVVDTDARGEPAVGVIFEGRVELITDPQAGLERGAHIYERYLGPEGVLEAEPQSWLHDPEHLLLRLAPSQVYAWGGADE
jgi:PPOX class probable F420-dependent enzyme